MEENMSSKLKNIYANQAKKLLFCLVFGVLVVVILGCGILMLGNTNYSLAEVMEYVFFEGSGSGHYAIWSVRLPKLIVGALAGLAFGISGYFRVCLEIPWLHRTLSV